MKFVLQLYVVYMGSRGSDGPDEVLRQNHQILTTLHRGRLLFHSLISCVFVGCEQLIDFGVSSYCVILMQ